MLCAICSSHIRQGGHRNACPLTSRLFVRIVVELAELLQPSIPVVVSTIYALLSKNCGAVKEFMLELVALLRRIIHVFGDEDLSRQVICASERSIPGFSTFHFVSSKIVDAVMKVMSVLVALKRRIICVFGDESFSRQVICASECAGTLEGLTWISEGYDHCVVGTFAHTLCMYILAVLAATVVVPCFSGHIRAPGSSGSGVVAGVPGRAPLRGFVVRPRGLRAAAVL